MKKLDRIIIAFFMMGVLLLGYRQHLMMDRFDKINQAIKALATATVDIKTRCDVAGERTDELWEEFDDN